MADLPYPAHWEADVVLRDGGTAHLRPIRPDDADRMVRFYARLSDETIYNRFFSLYRELSAKDIERFSVVDHVDRVALVATVGEEMIGVVRYERVSPELAEVAFNIEDAHQGRGVGSVFLEHIAAAARERGISRFLADVLPTNRKMLRVFQDAGYVVSHELDEGVVRLEFALEPTETSRTVTQEREHRSEALSVRRLLHPSSVAVVGASRSPESIGQTVLRHIVAGGFTGQVYAVNRDAGEVAGMPCYPSVSALPGRVEVVVVAVPAAEVDDVVADCAAAGVQALVVLSSGFAESGQEGRERQTRLVRQARGSGMRVLGPGSFGLTVGAPEVSLNASLSPVLPPGGRLGFFSQSGALGVALLAGIDNRKLGISAFVSAGNRGDVSANDLLAYWEDDESTDAVMLYVESLGNPRKFSRVARRLARRKPVVVVKAGRSGSSLPHGHLVRQSSAPTAAVEALFRQAGVIRVGTIHAMFDVGSLLAGQPLPQGPRVAIVSNSDALAVLARDACADAGLEVAGEPCVLSAHATAGEFAAAFDDVFEDAMVDSVVALFIPSLRTRDEAVVGLLEATAARTGKTVVATVLGMLGVPQQPHTSGTVTFYATPEDGVRALAAVTSYATWRGTKAGKTLEPSGLDVKAARAIVAEALGGVDEVVLDQTVLRRLLACYGIDLWRHHRTPTVEDAVVAASELGYPVALKTAAPHLRHRSDLGGVRLNVDDETELRGAYGAMAARLGKGSAGWFVVQQMAPTGVAVVLDALEDPSFGPVVSFGLGGVATELLEDRAYGIPPLTDADLDALVKGVRAAPLLFGHRGSTPVDTRGLHDLLARVARLADDLPEVAALELNPVVVHTEGLSVLGGDVRLARSVGRTDREARALLG